MSKALDGGGGVTQTKFDVTDANKFDPIQRTRMANSYVIWQSDSQSQGDFVTAPESKQDNITWKQMKHIRLPQQRQTAAHVVC